MNAEVAFTLARTGVGGLAGCTVLQIVSDLADANADRPAIDIAAALAEAGARPLVAAPAGPLVSELQAKGGVWLDFPATTSNPLTMLLASRRLRKVIAEEQVDLVHARARRAAWMAYPASRGARAAFVTSLHGISPGQSAVASRYNAVMAKGETVLASSNYAAATIAAAYPSAVGHVAVVRPGVDLGPLNAAAIAPGRVQALRHAWGVAPDQRIVLLVAKPSIWKGHKVLIEAVRLLVERGVADLKLVFVGDAKGPFGREIELALRAAQLGPKVKRVAGCGDMPAALVAAAVVVVPSIEAEAFGRIAVEAQAVGTPVVVSDVGALPETVLAPPDVDAARRTGWRTPPSDPGLLAEALGEALALGASGRDALGRRARAQVEERFAVARMTRDTLDRYASLLERRQTG